MTSPQPFPQRRHSEGGYVVRRPQVGDMLGGALRDAYGAEHSMPDDLQIVLAMLHRIDARR